MNKTRLLFCFGWMILLGAGMAAYLRGQESEVGIDEKLGSKVALNAVLKDEEGSEVTLGQLIDRPTILTLNYFRCTGICTPLLNSVADMLNQIGIDPGKDFRVITVSFDPLDTPDIASRKRINYLESMSRLIPPDAWRFLTGDAANTRRVADSVGFRFRADGDQYLHIGAIMVLAPDGTVVRYLYGITFLPADVQMAIADASAGRVRPSISKFLAFCYNYDPESRRYLLNLTRVAGGGILILLGGFLIFLLKGRSGRYRDRGRYRA
jgi:protein SCO1